VDQTEKNFLLVIEKIALLFPFFPAFWKSITQNDIIKSWVVSRGSLNLYLLICEAYV